MNSKAKKIGNIVMKVISWVLVAFTVLMMIFTIISVTTVDKNERDIFGLKFYIVQTDSMSKSENNKDMKVHFNAGDIIIVKNLSDKERLQLESGDIIAFISENTDDGSGYYPPYGSTITHMIREPKFDEKGEFLGYVTFGTNTGTDDIAVVDPGFILGRYVGKLPLLGHAFAFIKTVPGYITCILVPFIIIIVYNLGMVIKLFRQYRGEQMAQMKAEREQIDVERAENQRMMQELLALKAQLEQNSGAATPPPEPKSEAQAEETTEGANDEAQPEDAPENTDEQN